MHFAAFCYVGESVTDPLKYYFNNVVETLHLLRAMQAVASFFEPAVNVAERLAFDKVVGGGRALTAPMDESYAAFGLDPADTTSLEDYLKEYYDTILRRLREMEADLDKDAKKKLPF